MSFTALDQMWLLVCSGLVLLMQAGFLCLEAGLTRSKNAVNVALKNLVDLCLTTLIFVGFSSGVMFGASWYGLVGQPGAFGPVGDNAPFALLLFQSLFCASAATIVSGAVAERMRFGAYILICALIGAVVYPLIGHWAWGGVWTGRPGWLQALGFKDFAGAAVVHMTGGFAALAGAIAVGPRIGRFDPQRLATGFPKSSLPTAMLGALMLVVGWIGFNGGSVLQFDDTVGLVVLNTLIAGSAGGAVALAIAHLPGRNLSPEIIINGLLAGLVSVCALANVASPFEAILVGAVASVAAYYAAGLLVRLRIDDAVGAFPVHGVGGLVGIVAQPLASSDAWEQGLSAMLGVQALGGVAVAVMAFAPCYLLLASLPLGWRRVSAADERRGLNLAEHGVESELQTLLRSLGPNSADGSRVAEAIDEADEAGALAATVERRLSEARHDAEAKALVASQRQQADELRDYGRFLHAILDGVDLQIGILDNAGRIVEANSSWERFAEAAGVSLQAAVGASYTSLCQNVGVYGGAGSEEIARAVIDITQGRHREFSGEYPLLLDGKRRVLEVTVRPLPTHERGAVVVTQRDRTEERANERMILQEKRKAETLAGALEASQASLELAMKGGNLGLWHWDVTSGYFELSADWIERHTSEVEALKADIESFRALMHPDELDIWSAEDAATVVGDEPYDRQFRLRRPNGSYQWVQALGKAYATDEKGAPTSLSGILIDIDTRKNDELRDAGMAKIIEESLNEIFVIDRTTLHFVEVNHGARKNLGYSLGELYEMTPEDIKLPGAREDFRRRMERLASGQDTRQEFETVHVRRDGSTYPTFLAVQTGRLLDRDVIVAIGTDLTQRHELESQLEEARRLESIGQLAAGVAHEINTPLQYVSNNVSFLSDCSEVMLEVLDAYENRLNPERDSRPWEERQQELQSVLKRTKFEQFRAEAPRAIRDTLEGIDRVLQIVLAMKDFSHPGKQAKSPADLNQALSSTVTVTRNWWKTAAELELQLDPALPDVECEGGAINQVFVNLIVNAADAIGERHEKQADAPAGKILIRSYAEGDHAVFDFEDNGCGMPPDVQRRVFEPFYTTKEVGKGTGQGLSLSHNIVAMKHGGSITVHSTPGEGTTMRVSLPFKASADGRSIDSNRKLMARS